MTAESVLSFWFEEIEAKQWWAKSDEFDRLIATRFGALHGAAARCELGDWRETPQGRLAEVIVLDQFSRNIYRDQPQAFACDPLALALAQHAVALQADPGAARPAAHLSLHALHAQRVAADPYQRPATVQPARAGTRTAL